MDKTRAFMRTLSAIVVLFFAIGLQGQEGLVQERYPNGKLRNTQYVEGDLVRFVTYYESGRVKEMGGFRDGLRDGAWKQYAENGTVLCEALFDNGKRQGNWIVRNTANATTGRCGGGTNTGRPATRVCDRRQWPL